MDDAQQRAASATARLALNGTRWLRRSVERFMGFSFGVTSN
jgi:hypothetical protein